MMAGLELFVDVRTGDDAPSVGQAPGRPVVGGIVEAFRPEGLPREIEPARTNDEGVAALLLPAAGSYTVTLTHNVEGGGLLGDLSVEVTEDGQRVAFTARAFPA